MAMTGSASANSDRHAASALMAIWARRSASGCTSRPQSEKRKVPWWPKSQSGTFMTKNELTICAPGAVFRICRAGRSTSPVEWQAPETRPSASPIFTIIMPKYSSLSISSRACSSVMPFAARSSASFSA